MGEPIVTPKGTEKLKKIMGHFFPSDNVSDINLHQISSNLAWGLCLPQNQRIPTLITFGRARALYTSSLFEIFEKLNF